jgi:hypothetical protein
MNVVHCSRVVRILAVALATCGCAVAQYGGGGGTGGGTGTGTGGGTYSSRSYGNGAKIGVAVGAAAGAGLLFYALHRRHAQVVGCVTPDGKTLTTDKKKTYQLAGEPVTGGERLAISGKKMKGDSGVDEFQVLSVKKSLGQCQQQGTKETASAVP